MKVHELQAILADYDKDDLVVVSRDAEGNGHSPLYTAWRGAYAADTTWSGEVGFRQGDKLPDGYTDEDYVAGAPAVILGPTN